MFDMPSFLFGFGLATAIIFGFRAARLFVQERKYQKTLTESDYYFYSYDYPPLTRDQYIEVAGADPLSVNRLITLDDLV